MICPYGYVCKIKNGAGLWDLQSHKLALYGFEIRNRYFAKGGNSVFLKFTTCNPLKVYKIRGKWCRLNKNGAGRAFRQKFCSRKLK